MEWQSDCEGFGLEEGHWQKMTGGGERGPVPLVENGYWSAPPPGNRGQDLALGQQPWLNYPDNWLEGQGHWPLFPAQAWGFTFCDTQLVPSYLTVFCTRRHFKISRQKEKKYTVPIKITFGSLLHFLKCTSESFITRTHLTHNPIKEKSLHTYRGL